MSFDLHKEFAIDRDKEEKGASMELDADTTLYVRPTSYNPYRQAFAKEVYRNRRSLRKAGAAEDFNRKVNVSLVARFLVTGWDGELTDQGKAVIFSPGIVEDLFKRFPNFLDDVLSFASEVENYKNGLVEEISGK